MELKEILLETIPDSGSEIYRGYSGRCMYGKTCLGMTTDITPTSAVLHLAAAVVYMHEAYVGTENDFDLSHTLTELAHNKVDSMGLGTIIYWPSIKDNDPELEEDTE